jgi:hypothetical protein
MKYENKALRIYRDSNKKTGFICSINISLKKIYFNRSGIAIISFLNGRDLAFVSKDKFVIEVGGHKLFVITFIVKKDVLKMERASSSKLKLPQHTMPSLLEGQSVMLDLFEKGVYIRETKILK